MQVTQTRGPHVIEALPWCRAASGLSGTGARWPAPPLQLHSYGEAAEQPRHAMLTIILKELVYSSHINIHTDNAKYRRYLITNKLLTTVLGKRRSQAALPPASLSIYGSVAHIGGVRYVVACRIDFRLRRSSTSTRKSIDPSSSPEGLGESRMGPK
eukprot:5866662-Pleurochrysis_carterae.AAC.1